MYSGYGDKFIKSGGGMSFSRVFLKEKQLDEKLINPLIDAGRAKVVDRPGKGYHPSAGNAVVYLSADESVQESLRGISPDILRHTTNFFFGNADMINGMHIFPNTSPNALKGVSIDIRRDRLTGPTISKLNWSMGRGTRLIALPSYFDAETFIETEESLGEYARQIGIGTAGAVKSIKFYYDEHTYRVYLALAAGPTDHQKNLIRQQMRNVDKPVDLKQIRRMASRIGIKARDILADALLNFFPWKEDAEVVLDEPYIDIDSDNDVITAFSGGMKGSNNGIGTYTVGLSDMLMYDTRGKTIVPLGTKVVDDCSQTFSTGQNVKGKPFKSNSGMLPALEIDITGKLGALRPLKTLASAYHDGMVIEKVNSNRSQIGDPSL